MPTPFEKRKAQNLVRLRLMRGHILLMCTAIGAWERDKKKKEILELISELETEMALLFDAMEGM